MFLYVPGVFCSHLGSVAPLAFASYLPVISSSDLLPTLSGLHYGPMLVCSPRLLKRIRHIRTMEVDNIYLALTLLCDNLY